jgi:hypothetical protein
MEDIEMMFHEERTIVNMHFSTAFLIDENSESIIKTPYALAYTGWLKVKPSLTIDDCTRLLKERKRLLPKQGVYLTNISNSNIEEVYLLEKFALDKLFLMYRIKMDGRYFIGYYDIMQNFFYSLYKDCSLPEAQVVNFKIENFILELYSIMTTEVESNIDFVSSIENDEVDIKGNKTYNVYNRNDYDNTIKHVEAYIRKLPLGAVASDESKKLAERYGIKLGINETFVRAFDKSVRTKKDKN